MLIEVLNGYQGSETGTFKWFIPVSCVSILSYWTTHIFRVQELVENNVYELAYN